MKLAKRSTERHQHACIIVNGGSVQSFGINFNRNIPNNVEDITQLAVHAEESALKYCNRTNGAVAYVARVSNGKPMQSRPCPRCMQALKDAGIKRVIYTINGSEYL